MTGEEVRAFLPPLLGRAIVRDESIDLHLHGGALRTHFDTLGQQAAVCGLPGPITINGPAMFARAKGEVRLVLLPEARHSRPPLRSLIKAVAKAHHWTERILRGEVPNQNAIATETGLHHRYVGRILQLAFLAPDITEALLEGTQPHKLSLEHFRTDIPTDWGRQRHSYTSERI